MLLINFVLYFFLQISLIRMCCLKEGVIQTQHEMPKLIFDLKSPVRPIPESRGGSLSWNCGGGGGQREAVSKDERKQTVCIPMLPFFAQIIVHPQFPHIYLNLTKRTTQKYTTLL